MAIETGTLPSDRVEDIRGRRFGRLVVEAYLKSNVHYATKWRCVCDCGAIREVWATSLKTGATVSCGCWNKQRMSETFTTHGMTKHPLYWLRKRMMRRCNAKDGDHKKYYADKNITIHPPWVASVHQFIADVQPLWEEAQKSSVPMSIERIDNEKGYYPGNIKFATMKEQGNNRSNNTIIECFGKRQTLSQWADETGLSGAVISYRLKTKWPKERALTEPTQARKPQKKKSASGVI